MVGLPNFSDDFRLAAARKMVNRGGRTHHAVAAEVGVSWGTIYKWVADFRERGQIPRASQAVVEEPNGRTGYEPPSRPDAELEALRSERDRLKVETAALRQTIVLLGRRD